MQTLMIGMSINFKTFFLLFNWVQKQFRNEANRAHLSDLLGVQVNLSYHMIVGVSDKQALSLRSKT